MIYYIALDLILLRLRVLWCNHDVDTGNVVLLENLKEAFPISVLELRRDG